MSNCTVVNLSPNELDERKPISPSRYVIPAAEMEGEKVIKPGFLVIGPGSDYRYLGALHDDETENYAQIPIAPQTIAHGICEDYKDSVGLASHAPGVYFLRGEHDENSYLKTEIQKEKYRLALTDQHGWFMAQMRLADTEWIRSGNNPVNISEAQRRIARILGLQEEKPWVDVPKLVRAMIDCPACLTQIPKGAVVCQVCKCIIDPERHKKLQFAKEE